MNSERLPSQNSTVTKTNDNDFGSLLTTASPLCIVDKNETTESQIKIRFNTLCRQFEKNGKYLPVNDYQEIGESEDISYEMLVHKKEYQAAFYQVGPNGAASYYNKSLEEIEQLSNKVVWFTISERYGKYCIIMYYDNYKNQSNGEDL